MIEVKRATIRDEDGHQVIVLPDDIHFDENEVSIVHDLDTGELTVKRGRLVKASAKAFLEFLDSLDIPRHDLDTFMADRPLNAPLEPEAIFGDDK